MKFRLPVPSMSLSHLQALNKALQGIFIRLDNNKVSRIEGVAYLESYTVTTAPTASDHEGGVIYVSNDAGGATLAFSDGTNWRRVQDRAVIS